jgi:hypothetical protein
MAVGEVFFFETDQATGYETRDKFQILIDVNPGPPQEYIFMFISSDDLSGTDFPISVKECPVLKYDSYVSCGKLVRYDYNQLVELKIKKSTVTLSPEFLRRIHDHLDGHDVLAGREIAIAQKGLSKALSK